MTELTGRQRAARTTAGLALLAALVSSLSGCFGSEDRETGTSPTSPETAGASGAPTVAADAPEFCQDLVSDPQLKQLPEALRNAAVGKASAVDDLRLAARHLRGYADAGLGPAAERAAAALERIADNTRDLAATRTFAAAATKLDTDLESRCDTSK